MDLDYASQNGHPATNIIHVYLDISIKLFVNHCPKLHIIYNGLSDTIIKKKKPVRKIEH